MLESCDNRAGGEDASAALRSLPSAFCHPPESPGPGTTPHAGDWHRRAGGSLNGHMPGMIAFVASSSIGRRPSLEVMLFSGRLMRSLHRGSRREFATSIVVGF